VLELTEEVEKYRAILGPSTSPDVAQLSQLLKEKDEELEKLRLLDLQHSEVGCSFSSVRLAGITPEQ
jgi:hypothetical protein